MTNGGLSGSVDASDFKRLAAAAKGAEKDIQRGVRKALRDAAKPLGEEVSRKGSASMPSRGGLRARLARNKVGIAAALGGSNPKITLKLGAKPGVGLDNLNKGRLRHPVYGGKTWVSQRVPAGTYTEAFNEGAPDVRRKVAAEMDNVLRDIARKV